MVDENGANYCAIRKVFGLEFATSKVVSCQMHYKNDVNRASLKISDSYKDVFKNICHKMCSITTVAEYNDRKKWLEEIANIFPQITSWINWWDARKYHIFPAFRQLGYWNVTLAESGNSTLKWHTQLWLLEAAHDDTPTMLTQIHEVKSFLTQQTTSSGRGPCSLSHERADIETQICAARAYAAEFNNINAHSAALEENTNPQVFIPSSGARHRPSKDQDKHTGCICTKKKQRKTTVKKTSHIGLACQITVAEAILAEKEINCSPPCSQGPPRDNVPEVVLLSALGIRRWHGCKGKYWNKIARPQRFSVLATSSSNMENKGLTRLATMLWKCLFSLKNLMAAVTQQWTYNWTCHHGCWHICITVTRPLALSLATGLAGDNTQNIVSKK